MRAALLAAGLRLPAVGRRTSSSSATDPAARPARGAGPRRPPLRGRRSASRFACRPRTTGSSPRSGAAPAPASARSALVVRTTAETALRISLDLDGRGRARVATGDRLPRPPAHAARLPRRARPRAARRRRPRRRRAPHGRGRPGRARRRRSAGALDGRVGVTRYGSATVPMDEARATAAVDLVRRPHAEIALAFRGDRVGGLALHAAPARARAVRDAGRPDPPRRGAPARTTTTSPRRRSRRSAARCARRARATAPPTGSTKGTL